jgi:formate hydrogenlyase transcriptional activator
MGSAFAIPIETGKKYQGAPSLSQKLSEAGLEVIGGSTKLAHVLKHVETVAETDTTALILGETGTGKELIARAIHTLSQRRQHSFVSTNCASIPTGLLESELFGHEKGAYTGAIAREIGRFELANAGTIFLDEIGDIPLELQPKLLRVLQEREFERLGSHRTVHIDFRLVAATHRHLGEMVEKGTFRQDLFYRLNVFPIRLPALRERKEDIPALAWHFATKYARRMNKEIEMIRPLDMEALVQYDWPGNVRELQNCMERCALLSSDSVLCSPTLTENRSGAETVGTRGCTLAEAEREHILKTLRETEGVIGGANGAAQLLGVKRTTLLYKMRRLGISRPA